MKRGFVRQHIVPKRYLDRFSWKEKKGHVIGTRVLSNNNVKLFKQSTKNVGYIENYYDVSDKDDDKYWEHFFAQYIDYLCGKDLERIISKIALSQDGSVVLNREDKDVLVKIIVAQMMRVPQSIDAAKEIYIRTATKVKDSFLSSFPADFNKRFGDQVLRFELSPQWIKEDFFNLIFDPKNFNHLCQIFMERTWVVYVNTQNSTMPYTTSDNPVLVESIDNNKSGIFRNSLSNASTCIFFPLTPTIAVASYTPRNAFLSIIKDQIDDKKIVITDPAFVISKNYKITKQAFRYSFIPQSLFNDLMEEYNPK